jgi:hypothetical protein
MGSKQHAFISIISLLDELFPHWGTSCHANAEIVAKEVPRNILVYAHQEGLKEPQAVQLACIRAADLHRLPQLSGSMSTYLQHEQLEADYSSRITQIQEVLFGLAHPSGLMMIPMQPTKRQKRYDRVQIQKMTDPDYYIRKREYEKQYRMRLREAARHMSAENLQKLQALSEADRDACLPFMH